MDVLLPAARRFVVRRRAVLRAHPVRPLGAGRPASPRGPRRRPDPVQEPRVPADLAAGFRPRGHHLFSGVVRPDRLGLSGRVVFRPMACRHGGFRDRAAVDAWAGGIAAGPAER